jgi:hypothetical protein
MKDEERVKLASNLYACWEKLLPDACLSNRTGGIRGPLGWMERLFCVNCSAPGGYVTEAASFGAFYLCDACVQKHGHLPLPQIPDELIVEEE